MRVFKTLRRFRIVCKVLKCFCRLLGCSEMEVTLRSFSVLCWFFHTCDHLETDCLDFNSAFFSFLQFLSRFHWKRFLFCSSVHVVPPLPGDSDRGKRCLFLFWLRDSRRTFFVHVWLKTWARRDLVLLWTQNEIPSPGVHNEWGGGVVTRRSRLSARPRLL